MTFAVSNVLLAAPWSGRADTLAAEILRDLPEPCPSTGLVFDGESLLGFAPSRRLLRCLLPGRERLSLGDLLLPAPILENPEDWQSLSAAFRQTGLEDLPFWSAEENQWRLLNRGDFIRGLTLPRLWESLSLETIAAPERFFPPDLTAEDVLEELLAADLEYFWIASDRAGFSGFVRTDQLLNPGARRRPLGELARQDFPTLTLGQTYQDAQTLMGEQNSDFIRVIDSAGAELGYLGSWDFLAALAPERLTAWLAESPPPRRSSAETLLEQSQERLRYLLSASPVVIYTLRPEPPFDCLYMSPNAVKLLGYSPSELLRAPGQWQDRIASEYRTVWRAGLKELAESGRVCLEYPWSHPQGRVLWLRDERRLLKNARGQPQEIIGSLLDISANKQAELARELNEAHLQTIVGNVAEGIVILDPQQKVIFANAQSCQMFALRLEDLLGSSLNLSQLGDTKGEIEIWQGEQVGVGEIQNQSILWDAQPAQLVSIRNITARKLDAERARLSELRHQTLMETVPNIVWVIDSAGEIQEINQSALAYLGLERERIQPRLWRDIIHPEDQEQARRDWQRSNFELRAGRAEYRLRRWDGVYRWHLVQAKPIQPEAQGQFLWLGSCTDIEDLKQAEIQLRQQRQQEQLIFAIGQRIRRSLDLESILRTTVQEIRRTLKADRVLVYRTYDNGTGEAIAESVGRDWLRVLGFDFPEEVFPLECYQRYAEGYIFALTDRETGDVLDCLADFLVQIQVRAKLVAPIVHGKKLWGLLIAHQCSALREWQSWEINLLQQLSLQLAIAIQQAELYKQLEQELKERQQAETKLLEVSRLHQAILAGASYSIIAVDLTGKIITFNRAAERLLGYRAEEVLGVHTPQLFHDPEEMHTRARELSAVLGRAVPADMTVFTLPATLGEVQEREWTYLTKTGERIPVSLTVNALRDEAGHCVGFVGIANDIRERRSLEAERQTLDVVVKNSSEFIAIADQEQRITFLNQAGCALVGLASLQSAQQTQIADFHFPEDVPRVETEILGELARTGRWEGEMRLRHFITGRPIPVLVNAFVICDSTGAPLYWVSIMRDISNLKQAQQEMLQTLEKEKELSELRSRFISMASHEFRTPLAIIGSSTGILELYYQRLSDDKRQQHLQRIHRSVKHMTELLDDVLLVNRADAERLAFQPHLGNLRDFCRQLAAEIQLGAREQSIVFECGDSGLPQELDWDGVFDPKLLRQILTNLLSNALKYSPSAGAVRFTLTAQEDQAVFTIQDQGIGIPPEDLPRLFTSFHRASNVGAIQGTGLGLAIVKKCAELHRGTVTVDSVLGEGTCFTVRLPCFSLEPVANDDPAAPDLEERRF